MIPSPFAKYVRKSAADWTPSQGERGGQKWTNSRTGEVVYSPENPGGAERQAKPEEQPANASPSAPDEKTQGYATALTEKFGDKAGEQIDAMKAKLQGAPGNEAKIAALDRVKAALPKQEMKPPKPEGIPSPLKKEETKHGLKPDRERRLIRYDNGKPTKIHDAKPGAVETPEEHFDTSKRTGVIRNKEGGVLSVQLEDSSKADKFDMTTADGRAYTDLQGGKASDIAIKQYGDYMFDLGDQVVDSTPEEDDFDSGDNEARAAELQGHVKTAEQELTDILEAHAASRWQGDEYESGTMTGEAEDVFAPVYDAIEEYRLAENADEASAWASEIKDKLGDVHSKMQDIEYEHATRIERQREEADAAEEEAASDTIAELEGEDVQSGKDIARKYNQANKNGKYVIKWDKHDEEWFLEEKSLRKSLHSPLWKYK